MTEMNSTSPLPVEEIERFVEVSGTRPLSSMRVLRSASAARRAATRETLAS
jgi:hypothetical protein